MICFLNGKAPEASGEVYVASSTEHRQQQLAELKENVLVFAIFHSLEQLWRNWRANPLKCELLYLTHSPGDLHFKTMLGNEMQSLSLFKMW